MTDDTQKPSRVVAFLLLLFLGGIGIHAFYANRPKYGLLIILGRVATIVIFVMAASSRSSQDIYEQIWVVAFYANLAWFLLDAIWILFFEFCRAEPRREVSEQAGKASMQGNAGSR